jgi:transposase-like protein
MDYPSFWPKANPKKPEALQSRITEQQKRDLYHRQITTRDLAKLLNVHEKWLSRLFYSKEPICDKRPLIEARKLFKLDIAVQVLNGTYSMQQGADRAFVSYNTMQRYVQKAKEKHPELVEVYAKVVHEQRQLTVKIARLANTKKAGPAKSQVLTAEQAQL